MTITRCKSCTYPSTKPDLHFEDGECSACRNFKRRSEIDWKSREIELVRILESAPKNGTGYTAIVPSSGGKDSVAQAIKMIELGARPLIVTAATCFLTPVGRANIDNLSRYATTIEVTPNRTVRAKLNRLGLELVGDCSWSEHASIFSVPFRVAADLGIATIVYGEAPQFEYGGPPGSEAARTMTRRWVSEYAGLLGLRATDFVGMEGITEADMKDYMLPSDEKLAKVTAYWLGQYIPWSSRGNAEVAVAHGMRCQLPGPANWWDFENLDGVLVGLHDHGMFRKFGFGRLAAQISVDIRNGLISRDEAMEIVRERDGLFPWAYMGVAHQQVLEYLGMSDNQLMAALDKHTNWELFDGIVDRRPILKEFARSLQSA